MTGEQPAVARLGYRIKAAFPRFPVAMGEPMISHSKSTLRRPSLPNPITFNPQEEVYFLLKVGSNLISQMILTDLMEHQYSFRTG
jgi:hypothetical protein